MKKNIFFLIAILLIIECQGQDGLSLSYSTNNTFGIDIFAREGNNRLHFGYSHQFNGQEGKVEKTNVICLINKCELNESSFGNTN